MGGLDLEDKERDRVLGRPFMLMTTKPCLVFYLFFKFLRIRFLFLFTLHCANVFIFCNGGKSRETAKKGVGVGGDGLSGVLQNALMPA